MSGTTIVCRNPADAREVVATYAAHGPADVAAMCARADIAQAHWGGLPGPRRGELLHRAADLLRRRGRQLARRIVAEEGKLLADATGEVERAVTVLHFHAGEAERLGGELADAAQAGTLAFTRRRPLGVVGLITPWNFPIAIPAWKLAPALAAGNAVVIKPSSAAPGAVLELVEVLHEAGVPGDVVQVVLGGSQVGLALASDPHVRALSFTGSTAVGRELARRLSGRGFASRASSAATTRWSCSPTRIPCAAVELAARARFAAAGQKCTATRRLIVERPLYEAVLAAFAERARELVLGAGGVEGVQVPPLIDSGAAESCAGGGCTGVCVRRRGAQWRRARRRRAPLRQLRCADRARGRAGRGCACSTRRSLVRSVRCSQHATSTRRSRSRTRCPSVCRQRSARTICGCAFEFVARSDAGMVHVNRSTPGGDPHMPFGGLKDSSASGWREQGTEAVRFFTEQQTVYLHQGARRGPR